MVGMQTALYAVTEQALQLSLEIRSANLGARLIGLCGSWPTFAQFGG